MQGLFNFTATLLRYHNIRLKPETAKKLIEIIKNNFNRRYLFKNKQYTLENIMFENIRDFGKYILDKNSSLEFNIPEIIIDRNDDSKIREKINAIAPEERKKLKINKSTLWYQQRKKLKRVNRLNCIIKQRGK